MDNKIKNQKTERVPIFVLAGIFFMAGFFTNDFKTIDVNELKVYSNESSKDQEDIDFSNMLGLASFEGSWEVIGSDINILNEVNAVKVNCWLDTSICNVAQANIYQGSDLFDKTFSNDIDYYDIVEWTNNGRIVAKVTSGCEDTIINADMKTRVVTLTESTKEGADKEFCADQEPVLMKLIYRNKDY